MDWIGGCFFGLVALAAMAGVLIFNFRLMAKVRAKIETALMAKGWTPTAVRLSWTGGPWPASAVNHHPVFRVRARDAEGRDREGWMRCASWWDDVDAERWDADESNN